MRRHTTRWVPACLCYRSSSSNRKWMRTHFEKCFEIHGMSPFCLSHNQVSTLSVLPATISPRPKTPRCCYALLVVMCSFRSCSFHPDRIYIYISLQETIRWRISRNIASGKPSDECHGEDNVVLSTRRKSRWHPTNWEGNIFFFHFLHSYVHFRFGLFINTMKPFENAKQQKCSADEGKLCNESAWCGPLQKLKWERAILPFAFTYFHESSVPTVLLLLLLLCAFQGQPSQPIRHFQILSWFNSLIFGHLLICLSFCELWLSPLRVALSRLYTLRLSPKIVHYRNESIDKGEIGREKGRIERGHIWLVHMHLIICATVQCWIWNTRTKMKIYCSGMRSSEYTIQYTYIFSLSILVEFMFPNWLKRPSTWCQAQWLKNKNHYEMEGLPKWKTNVYCSNTHVQNTTDTWITFIYYYLCIDKEPMHMVPCAFAVTVVVAHTHI